MRFLILTSIVLSFTSCVQKDDNSAQQTQSDTINVVEQPSLIILGTIQDAGSPHIGCKKACCKDLFTNPDKNRMVVSLGLIDPSSKTKYLIEATPDISRQLELLRLYSPFQSEHLVDGVFLTHAHIGHYSGLMYFGKEAVNAKAVKTYSMPKMTSFLNKNGPWSQLLQDSNIVISGLMDQEPIQLNKHIELTPIVVPHRDEYSETVGYRIKGPNKTALFIPDINKWNIWENDITEEIKKVDYAFLDATFYDGDEINNRDISEIPHPFVVESMELFKNMSKEEKSRIYFIHFNHTNPLINLDSPQAKLVLKNGFKIAQVRDIFAL